jgi:hypothetical protein
MPITSTNPIIKDGIEYPYFTVNLAVSPFIQETDIGGSCAMKLTPYRVKEDGTFEFLEENAIPFSYLDVFITGDTDLVKATMTIMGSIQQFIIDKNI